MPDQMIYDPPKIVLTNEIRKDFIEMLAHIWANNLITMSLQDREKLARDGFPGYDDMPNDDIISELFYLWSARPRGSLFYEFPHFELEFDNLLKLNCVGGTVSYAYIKNLELIAQTFVSYMVKAEMSSP